MSEQFKVLRNGAFLYNKRNYLICQNKSIYTLFIDNTLDKLIFYRGMKTMIESKVRHAMKSKGITIEQLAKVTGLSTHTIMRSRSEYINRCTLSTLKTLARALDCNAKDLFEEVSRAT